MPIIIFTLFENIARFILFPNNTYDIGILEFNGFKFLNSIVVSSEGFQRNTKAEGTARNLGFVYEDWIASPLNLIWELAQKRIDRNLNEWEERLFYAIQWVGKANFDRANENTYVQYIFALETLLLSNPKGVIITPSIASQISEYVAFILGTDMPSRISIEKDVKTIYGRRSAIVHGNTLHVENELIKKAFAIIYNLIYTILNTPELYSFKNIDDLAKWVKEKKYT